jgi:excisionase family DNA binding protein
MKHNRAAHASSPERGHPGDDDGPAGQSGDRLLTVDDVSDYLGLSRDFVYDQVRLGTLRSAKMARQLRFRRSDIDDFVDKHTVADGARAS